MLPLLCLHCLSPGGFVPAMEQFPGSAAGLSPATVTRLTRQWTAGHGEFQHHGLAGPVTYAYGPTPSTPGSGSRKQTRHFRRITLAS